MTPLPPALQTLVTACDAACGLIDLRVPTTSGEQRITTSRNVDPATELRARTLFSSGIIAEALASGEVVRTASALADPRFSDRSSVQEGQIRAVLCAPLGDGLGVVYLERDAPFEASSEDYVRGWCEGIAPLITRALEARAERRPGGDPTQAARAALDCEDLIGRSEALARTLDQVLLARLSSAPVLVTGPTGAGKSTVARIIHRNSRRASGPFQAANAANLQGELTAAELFGVASGAATSVRARQGLIAQAHGGTLFLDEVGLLPLDTQARLLTFLDSGTYRQVGRDRDLHADVRLLSATNEDLHERVRQGTFRADLLFRLNVLQVYVPPLRDRPTDIPALAQHVLVRTAREDGLEPLPLDPLTMGWLQSRPWPGQVRELRNALHRGLLRAHAVGAPSIRPEHLDPAVRPSPSADEDLDLRRATAGFQRAFLVDALARHRGNRTATARAVGLSRSRFYELLNALEIEGS